MDTKSGDNASRDDDGIPVDVIRDIIRRSLESAQPLSNFFRVSDSVFETDTPVCLPDPHREIELGPPVSQRLSDGLLTGFRDFDSIVGGLRKGELITLAGLPSSGSSTLVLNIVRRIVSTFADKAIGLYTPDITKDKVVQRLLSAEARIDRHSASAGLLRDSDWERLTEGVQRLWNGKLFLTDDRMVSLDALHDVCAQRKRGIGLDLIVLDRVNILGVDHYGITPPLGETMAELKEIAEKFDVPILLTFTADFDSADDVTGHLIARRLAPAIQVYSDVLTLLHRPDQWEMQSSVGEPHEVPERQKGLEVVELHIARQKGGPSDTLRLALNARWGRFDNVLWD